MNLQLIKGGASTILAFLQNPSVNLVSFFMWRKNIDLVSYDLCFFKLVLARWETSNGPRRREWVGTDGKCPYHWWMAGQFGNCGGCGVIDESIVGWVWCGEYDLIHIIFHKILNLENFSEIDSSRWKTPPTTILSTWRRKRGNGRWHCFFEAYQIFGKSWTSCMQQWEVGIWRWLVN